MDSYIIVLYIILYFAIISELDHASIYLEDVVPDWPEWSDEVVYIIGHTCVDMVVKYHDKGIGLQF